MMTWLDTVSIKDTKLVFQRFLDRCLFSIQFSFILLYRYRGPFASDDITFLVSFAERAHIWNISFKMVHLTLAELDTRFMCLNLCWEYFVPIRNLFSVNYYVIYYQQMYQQFSPLDQLRISNGRLIYFSKAMALSSSWSNITSVTDLQQIASLLNYYFK